jgi:hypothetical protein
MAEPDGGFARRVGEGSTCLARFRRCADRTARFEGGLE